MMVIRQVLELAGLGAALIGAVAVVRGDWETAAGCLVATITVSFLAVMVEPPRRQP